MYVIELTEPTESGEKYILDDVGETKRFKNATSARDYLRDIGVRRPEREGYEIVPEKEAALEPVA